VVIDMINMTVFHVITILMQWWWWWWRRRWWR